jgi:hypothetical protein
MASGQRVTGGYFGRMMVAVTRFPLSIVNVMEGEGMECPWSEARTAIDLLLHRYCDHVQRGNAGEDEIFDALSVLHAYVLTTHCPGKI